MAVAGRDPDPMKRTENRPDRREDRKRREYRMAGSALCRFCRWCVVVAWLSSGENPEREAGLIRWWG